VIEVRRNVAYTQGYGCRFCLHVGSVAFFFGRVRGGAGPRLEVLTPRRWFRWSSGYRDRADAAAAG
jgi:hypothetical protein